jgi:lipopolysaccharide/colanic/teichoic acid biosynthesis glycosyltransferase
MALASASVTTCPSFGMVPRHRVQGAIKRAIDLLVAAVLLVVTAPLLLVIAIAVKIDSRGPVFFGQARIGKDMRPFKIWKFRSMRDGAETEQVDLADRNDVALPLFKLVDDPRVTRVGRHLRRWSLDELPQLWNVLIGDMSLVGPRPPLPQEVMADGLRQSVRLHARPGVTGPWQVNGRSALPYSAGVALDIDYVRNWSLGADVRILFRTPAAVFTKRGAY